MAGELCVIKSMMTEQINHGPAITFMQTGHQLPGRPSIGAWLSYGLGNANRDLPSFVVMKEETIREALTGDRDFEQAGFVALLR